MAQPGVTTLDLDVLRRRALLFKASLPRDDTVGAGVDCRARHSRRDLHCFSPRPIAGGAPAQGFVEPPGVARLRLVGERAAERDYLSHQRRRPPRQLARKDTAEAPSNQANLTLITPSELGEPCIHAGFDTGAWTMVRALLPAVRRVTLRPQIGSQRPCRNVARGKTRQHEHRMTVAARRTPQERISREERLQLPNAAHFECQQQPRRWPYTISGPLHVKNVSSRWCGIDRILSLSSRSISLASGECCTRTASG